MKLSDEVYEKLKREILEGELTPGTPLSENEVARRLDSSRTPVRESLQRLAHDGLVRLISGRGALVTEIAASDIVEIFQMRTALETYAARLAARSGFRSSVLQLIDRLDEAASELQKSATYRPRYYALSHEIDKAIVALASNQRLGGALEDIWNQAYRLRHLASSNPGRLLKTVDEHRLILTAIAEGDEAAAAFATETHLEHSLENILSSMWRPAGSGPASSQTLSP